MKARAVSTSRIIDFTYVPSQPYFKTRDLGKVAHTRLYFRYYARAENCKFAWDTYKRVPHRRSFHFPVTCAVKSGGKTERGRRRRSNAEKRRVFGRREKSACIFLACAKSPRYNSAPLSRGGISKCKCQAPRRPLSRVSHIGKSSNAATLSDPKRQSYLRPNNAPGFKAILTCKFWFAVPLCRRAAKMTGQECILRYWFRKLWIGGEEEGGSVRKRFLLCRFWSSQFCRIKSLIDLSVLFRTASSKLFPSPVSLLSL